MNVCYLIGLLVLTEHLSWASKNVDVRTAKIFSSNKQGSHFGYSVTFHRTGSNQIRAMIGAPKANSSLLNKVIEPGVVHECNIDTLTCNEVEFEKTGNGLSSNTEKPNFEYKDLKNHMFLGGSIDSSKGVFLACAHLWKNQRYSSIYLSNGLCYVINKKLEPRSTRRFIPLLNRSEQADADSYKFAFGMSGFSSTFTERGFLLGAPGISNYIGSSVFIEVEPGETETHSISKIANIPNYHNDIGINSYFGYSVTHGRFFGTEEYFVSGAPKSKETGSVYIYKALTVSKRLELYAKGSMVMRSTKHGKQIGEYFGSAVCVVNLNGDGYDDLLVGSPFYSSKGVGDHGRVYVYISDGKSLVEQDVNIVGSLIQESRFGSAISSIGDLNQDGFDDVVIGAPYENSGAVYIYHGSNSGISSKYDQRIEASEISKNLKGFGISIAKGSDSDGNQYNDLLIGSYLSDQAVLLRTRPVIQVEVSIDFSVAFLDLNSTKCVSDGILHPCFEASACIKYLGKHVPKELDFDVLFEMETLRRSRTQDYRGYMLDSGTKVTQASMVIRAKHEEAFCKKFEVHIYKNVKDTITPVQFKLSYKLKKPLSENLNALLPVIDNKLSNFVTNQLLLQTNCGSDNLCSADLHVDMRLMNLNKQEALVIGEKKNITLAVKVKSLNETAIHSEVHLEFQKEIEFKNLGSCEIPGERLDRNFINITKKSGSKKMIVCKTLPQLERNQEEEFLIKLGLSELKPGSNLVINAVVKTRSHETNLKNNNARISLPVIALADITLKGSTKTSQVIYKSDKFENKKVAEAVHTYKIIKMGASRIQSVKLFISIPIRTDDRKFPLIKFKSLKVEDNPFSVNGDCDTSNLPLISQEKKIDDIIDPRVLKSTKSLKLGGVTAEEQKIEGKAREKREAKATKVPKSTKPATISNIVNCTNAQCVGIACTFGPFTDNSKTGKVEIVFELNISSILGIFPDSKDAPVGYQSKGKLLVKDEFVTLPTPDAPKTDNVTTTLLSTKLPKPKPIELWIIIVSVIAGILLLLIILVILVKCGFFKRKVKEDMEKLKTNAEIAEWEKLVDQPPPENV